MKKILFVITTMLCMYACTNERCLEESNNMLEQRGLYTVFMSLNDSLLNVLPKENYVVTRADWNWWRILKVASADIRGAYKGVKIGRGAATVAGLVTGGAGAAVITGLSGAVGAACYSFCADLATSATISEAVLETELVCEAYTTAKEENVNYINLQFPSAYAYMNISGGMHNSILKNLAQIIPITTIVPSNSEAVVGTDRTDSDNSGDTETSIMTTSSTLESAVPIINTVECQQLEQAVFSSTEFAESMDEIPVSVAGFYQEDGELDIEKYLASADNDMTNNESAVFKAYMEMCWSGCTSLTDLIEVANAYIAEITNQSQLTIEEKESLFLMIAVSINSVYYWQQK